MIQRSKRNFLTWICVGILWSQLLVGVKISFDVSKAVAAQLQENSHQEVSQSVKPQTTEASRLYETGQAYSDEENYPLALRFFQLALKLYQESGDRSGEISSLYGIAITYQQQGQYELALSTIQQALTIAREVKDQDKEWRILTSIGEIYRSLGEYTQAITHHQQALKIVQSLNQPLLEQAVHNNLGLVYSDLGELAQALKSYQQALHLLEQVASSQTLEEHNYSIVSQSYSLSNIGNLYSQQRQYSRAIVYYQRALALQRQTQSRDGEAEILNSLGFAYNAAGQSIQALPLIEQALQISQELGDKNGTAYTLDSLGTVYAHLQNWQTAWSAYQQSLTILTEINDRPGQWLGFSHIGDLLVQQNQPELAIVFYKRSVNVTEAIRRDIQTLPVERRQSYTDLIADTYRTLADLLLQQNRVLEAQQVLDLLKVQEVEDYLQRRVRGTEQTAPGIQMLPSEQQASDSYDALLKGAIAQGQERFQLEDIPPENRTPAQQQQLIELRQNQQKLKVAFVDFLAEPGVQAAIQQLQFKGAQAIDTASLDALRNKLQNLQGAVLLYPLILENRLELVLLSPNTPPIHYSVPVGRVELNHAISDFLTVLKDPNADAKPAAQRLYNWLIRPIEPYLSEAGAQTVLYAPDGQLRYVPLAALYDGKQWLVERFRINHITAVSLFNLDTPPITQPHIFAGAFGEGRVNIQRGEYHFPFTGLPFAKAEVEAIGHLFPNTKELIDLAFTRDATVLALNDYNIVHFATHAIFTTGAPDDSFIVFGDGGILTLRDINSLSLTNVDLMVLSGCQTAVNSVSLGDGKEILGFGYQIQSVGARAAIASLWSVDDGGTEELMSRFYSLLRQGNISKAAALQQAQIALIHGAAIDSMQQTSSNILSRGNLVLSHPHYWSPFILIGNGL